MFNTGLSLELAIVVGGTKGFRISEGPERSAEVLTDEIVSHQRFAPCIRGRQTFLREEELHAGSDDVRKKLRSGHQARTVVPGLA